MSRMVVAIDPSLTSTGLAVGKDKADISRWTPDLKGPQRLQWFFDQTVNLIGNTKPDVLAIEGYAFRSKDTHAHGLGELGGVIRLAAWMSETPVLEVAPPKIKKFATGKGNAGKHKVLTDAVRRLDYQGHSDDEADALWLWFLTQTWLRRGVPPCELKLPQTHLSALNGLKNGLWKP